MSEPSAKSLLKRLGIRKATKKASADALVPRYAAMTASLTNPKILLKNVDDATIPAEENIFLLEDIIKLIY